MSSRASCRLLLCRKVCWRCPAGRGLCSIPSGGCCCSSVHCMRLGLCAWLSGRSGPAVSWSVQRTGRQGVLTGCGVGLGWSCGCGRKGSSGLWGLSPALLFLRLAGCPCPVVWLAVWVFPFLLSCLCALVSCFVLPPALLLCVLFAVCVSRMCVFFKLSAFYFQFFLLYILRLVPRQWVQRRLYVAD